MYPTRGDFYAVADGWVPMPTALVKDVQILSFIILFDVIESKKMRRHLHYKVAVSWFFS